MFPCLSVCLSVSRKPISIEPDLRALIRCAQIEILTFARPPAGSKGVAGKFVARRGIISGLVRLCAGPSGQLVRHTRAPARRQLRAGQRISLIRAALVLALIAPVSFGRRSPWIGWSI